MKALSLLDTPAPSFITLCFIGGSIGVGAAVGVGASLFRDLRADLCTGSGSVPVSVSEALGCLALGVLVVLFVGLLATGTSDSLSSDFTLVVLLPDLARGVGGGGISSSSTPTVLS